MKSHGRLQKDDYVLVMSHSIAGVSADYKLDRYIAICFKIFILAYTLAKTYSGDSFMQ